jgi:adenosine kinase
MSGKVADVKEGVLLGIGNSLLDMTIVTDQAFLDRFDLLPNNAIIAGERQKNLYNAMVEEYEPSYLPGGATQNSIRVAQWLLRKPKATTFFGTVGNDKFAEILKSTAEQVGVNVRYQIVDGMSTGRCGALITGENRSLVTELGAAEHFHAEYLSEPDNWKLIEQAKYFYIGGFFLPVSMDAVLKLCKHAVETDKTVVMNLHATFLCKHFADKELNLMQYVDVLFGNGDEAAEFSKLMGFNTSDVKEMAVKTSQLPKLNKSRERIVVFTQGKDPTVIAQGGVVNKHKIVPVKHELIKDTNGCGDAFVGGFLSQLAQGKQVSDCLRCGIYASKVVIRYFGCNYPDEPDYE